MASYITTVPFGKIMIYSLTQHNTNFDRKLNDKKLRKFTCFGRHMFPKILGLQAQNQLLEAAPRHALEERHR